MTSSFPGDSGGLKKNMQGIYQPLCDWERESCYLLLDVHYSRKFFVVRSSAGRVDETTRDPRYEEVVADEEFDGMVYFLAFRSKHVVELFGLPNCARESI